MNKSINLNSFNGNWNIIHDSDNSSQLVWSNGIYTLSYTNNIFGRYGQGWVVRMKQPDDNDIYWYSYIPGQFFAIKTDGAPWSEDREIIYSKMMTGFNNIDILNALDIVIEEKGGILLNPEIKNNVLDYQGVYNYPVIIKIAQMSNGDNINLNCTSNNLLPNLQIKKIIHSSSSDSLEEQEYYYNYDELSQGIYLIGRFNDLNNGFLNINLNYRDEYGFNSSKQVQINYNLISPITIQSKSERAIVSLNDISNSLLFENLNIYYLKYYNNVLNSISSQVNWLKYNGQEIELDNNQCNVAFYIKESYDINFKFNTSGGKIDILGNITSLFNFNNETYNFKECFKNNINIINANDLLLPTENLDDSCFESMFEGCISLISTPLLSSMHLSQRCYANMFEGCTSLIQAPILPAKILKQSCYEEMFKGCLSLNKIEVGFIDWNETLYTLNWVEGVAETGIFIKFNDLQEIYDESHIPKGWSCNSLIKGFTINALKENTTVQFTKYDKVYYKTNYNDWSIYNQNQKIILNNIDDYVMFKNESEICSINYNNYYYFDIEGQISIEGDIQSLLNNNKCTQYSFYRLFQNCTALIDASKLILSSSTLASSCYAYMFYGCESLTSAPELPSIELASSCYAYMFYGCASLIQAPALQATTLADYCYAYMFYGCASLIQAPELPAIELASSCYGGMFSECISLTKAPELRAKILVENCYESMFAGCTNLNYIYVYFNEWNDNTLSWVYNVSSSGTFIKPRTLQTIVNSSHIPTGWIIENDITNPLQIPLTFTSLIKNSSVRIVKNNGNIDDIQLLRSYDKGKTYKDYPYQINEDSLWIDLVNSGQTISFSSQIKDLFRNNEDNYYHFQFKGKFELSGNFTSLNAFSQSIENCNFMKLFKDGSALSEASNLMLPLPLTISCYESMFEGCVYLYSSPKFLYNDSNYLLFPSCYKNMFKDCVRLKDMPELTSTSLAESCYEGMFERCASLTSINNLPAIELFPSCYKNMFKDCTSLTKSPKILAYDLVEECCNQMFYGCKNLKEIEVSFLYWRDECTVDWVKDVSQNGLFTKHINLQEVYGNNYIPTGWGINNILDDEIVVQSPILLEAQQCMEFEGLQLIASSLKERKIFFELKTELPLGLTLSREGLISGTALLSGEGITLAQAICSGAENKEIEINWVIKDSILDINIKGLTNDITVNSSNSSLLLIGLFGNIDIITE